MTSALEVGKRYAVQWRLQASTPSAEIKGKASPAELLSKTIWSPVIDVVYSKGGFGKHGGGW
jgi:hypothetical protein